MNQIKPLTEKQQKVLEFIQAYQNEHCISPTLKEIAAHLGTHNISTAQYFLDQIKLRGHLERVPNISRGISRPYSRTVPLLGRIAAGKPIEAIENSEPISIPSNIHLNESSSYYALEIVGDSMIDMGILNRDIVLIQHQFSANNGDVVVAIINGEATLKVYRLVGKQIILEARNPSFEPIVLDKIEIRGKFVGLIRMQ